MKSISKRINTGGIAAFVLIALLVMQGCKDNSLSNSGDYNDPVSISGVRYASPDSTSDIEQVGPGDVLALEGNNMDAVAHVYFNGYEASFNPALATKSHLMVTVPADMPFGEMDPEASYMNHIKVTNSASQDSLSFPILPPVPQISDISNEYATPGETITITGQYLYLVTDVSFPGDVSADLASVNTAPDGSWMEVSVPEGATTEGDIIISSAAGASPPSTRAEFLQSVGMLCNFDDVQNWEWWSAQSTSDATNFPGASGNFAVMSPDGGEIASGDNSWWTSFRSINLNQGEQWIDPGSVGEALSNFAIKFELAINGSWSTGTLLLRTENNEGWTYSARYEPWRTDGGVNPVEYDGWRTVTIPLNDFREWGGDDEVDGGGARAPSIGALLPDGQAPYPGIMLYNDLDGAIPADLEFAVDNIRVVRIAN